MKFAVPVSVLFAAVGLAQSTNISDCARMCVNNMHGLAESLGCSSDDAACLCNNQNFKYGVHDCTVEACPGEDVNAVVATALAICPSAVKSASAGTSTLAGTRSAAGATQSRTAPASSAAETAATTASATVSVFLLVAHPPSPPSRPPPRPAALPS
ncbi:hypothetical protein VTN02DRAFT_4346 [Thermoascus thermophilus]